MKYSPRSKRLSGINVYMTNTLQILSQWDKYMIGILYVGKLKFYLKRGNHSFTFIIAKIKRERLECHLYGQLIAILLCSSIMFQMRKLLLTKKKQELSEYKAIYMIKDYFSLLFRSIQKDTQRCLPPT